MTTKHRKSTSTERQRSSGTARKKKASGPKHGGKSGHVDRSHEGEGGPNVTAAGETSANVENYEDRTLNTGMTGERGMQDSDQEVSAEGPSDRRRSRGVEDRQEVAPDEEPDDRRDERRDEGRERITRDDEVE